MTKTNPTSDAADARPWSVPISKADVPDTGRRFEIVADEGTRAKIAKLANLASIPRLTATFEIIPRGESLRLVGVVSALVEQTCVITLEPVENVVEETVDLIFAPGAVPAAAANEHLIEVGLDDPPEIMDDGTIDLGAIASEFLMLGIDPYPRKPGAAFESSATGVRGASPFAALAALKASSGGKKS